MGAIPSLPAVVGNRCNNAKVLLSTVRRLTRKTRYLERVFNLGNLEQRLRILLPHMVKCLMLPLTNANANTPLWLEQKTLLADTCDCSVHVSDYTWTLH